MEVKTYRDLLVWQKSIDLVTQIYQVSKIFPAEELYGLTSQLRRSAVSIPSNIAEGHGRPSTGDFLRFLGIDELIRLGLPVLFFLDKNLFKTGGLGQKMADKICQR